MDRRYLVEYLSPAMRSSLQGILFDLDETRYSREDAFWRWIESEGRAVAAWRELDRERIAALDPASLSVA